MLRRYASTKTRRRARQKSLICPLLRLLSQRAASKPFHRTPSSAYRYLAAGTKLGLAETCSISLSQTGADQSWQSRLSGRPHSATPFLARRAGHAKQVGPFLASAPRHRDSRPVSLAYSGGAVTLPGRSLEAGRPLLLAARVSHLSRRGLLNPESRRRPGTDSSQTRRYAPVVSPIADMGELYCASSALMLTTLVRRQG